MEVSAGLWRAAVYFGLFAAMLYFEWRAPFAARKQRKVVRVTFHLGLSMGNTVLLYLLLAPIVGFALGGEQTPRFGLAGILGLRGGVVEILAAVVVLDLWDYWMHLANHKVRLLWRFHRVHHSDEEVDVTTAARFHIGELLISGLVKAIMIVVWGPSLWGLVVFDTLLTTASQFHHGNVRIPLRVQDGLERFVVTPRMHRAHHATHRDCFNTNYSTIFSFWDRFFGSYHWSQDVRELEMVGLFRPRGRETMEVVSVLLAPFRNG